MKKKTDNDVYFKFNSSFKSSADDDRCKSPWRDELKFDNKNSSTPALADAVFDSELCLSPENKRILDPKTDITHNKTFSARSTTPMQIKCEKRRSTVSCTKKNSKYNWAGTFSNKAKKRISFHGNGSSISKESADYDDFDDNLVVDENALDISGEKSSNLKIDQRHSASNLIDNNSLKTGDRRQNTKFSNIDRSSDSKLNNLIASDSMFSPISGDCYFIKNDATTPAKVNIFANHFEKRINSEELILMNTTNIDRSILKSATNRRSKSPSDFEIEPSSSFRSNFNPSPQEKIWTDLKPKDNFTSLEKCCLEKSTDSNIADISTLETLPSNEKSTGKSPLIRFALNLITNIIIFTFLPAVYIAFFVYLQNGEE